MINPFQSSTMPNADGFQDPLSFVQKLWGDMKIPGMVTPTLSVDELDQQIKDLKAVESWLSLNMNMLRSSIHALEVQRSTIAALKTMGESFTKQKADFEKGEEVTKAEPKPTESSSVKPDLTPAWAMPNEANAWWNVVQDQFKQALHQVVASEENTATKTKATSTSKATKQASPVKKVQPAVKTKTAATTQRKTVVKKISIRKPKTK